LLLHFCDSLASGIDNCPTVTCEYLMQHINQVLAKKPSLYVINVLPKTIYKDCQIPGSINFPTHTIQKRMNSWPRADNIIIYCAGSNCPLSKYAYQTLKQMGFLNVSILEGGLRLWKKKTLAMRGLCKYGYLNG
jgi:rhodanese-related sulfurtransferase